MDKKKPPEAVKESEVHFCIETEREEDGRWIAEIADIPVVPKSISIYSASA